MMGLTVSKTEDKKISFYVIIKGEFELGSSISLFLIINYLHIYLSINLSINCEYIFVQLNLIEVICVEY